MGGITDVKNQIRYFVDSGSILKDTESGIEKVLDVPNLKQKESPYMVRVSASQDKIMSLILRYEGISTGVCLADLNTQDIQIIEKDLSYPELAYNREIPVVFYPLDVERGVDIYYGDTLEKTLRFLPKENMTSIYIETYTMEPEDPYILCQYSEDSSNDKMILFDFAAEQYAMIQSDNDASIIEADLSDDAKLVLSIEIGEPDRIVIRELEEYPFQEFPQEWRPAE